MKPAIDHQATTAGVELARLDRRGVIVSVNKEWERFCRVNGGDLERCGPGQSYIDLCDRAGDPASARIGTTIRAALRGDLLIPVTTAIRCDSPGELRWFDVAVYPRHDDRGFLLGTTVAIWRVSAPLSRPYPEATNGHSLAGPDRRDERLLLDDAVRRVAMASLQLNATDRWVSEPMAQSHLDAARAALEPVGADLQQLALLLRRDPPVAD